MGTLAKIRRLHLREGVPDQGERKAHGTGAKHHQQWAASGADGRAQVSAARAVQTKLDGFTEQLATWLKADARRGKRDRRTVRAMYEELVAVR